MTLRTAASLFVVAGASMSASAQIFTLTAVINGLQEVPPTPSPATGFATLVIDTTTNAWSLDLTFNGLTAPVTVAHIHRAAAGVNGPVQIGLDGIALSGGRPTWALISPGVTSFSSGGALTAPFAYPAAEVANLLAGNMYINIHTMAFGGGEIRGQLRIPTPGAAASLGLAGLIAMRRRR